jgi:hypothetical protein
MQEYSRLSETVGPTLIFGAVLSPGRFLSVLTSLWLPRGQWSPSNTNIAAAIRAACRYNFFFIDDLMSDPIQFILKTQNHVAYGKNFSLYLLEDGNRSIFGMPLTVPRGVTRILISRQLRERDLAGLAKAVSDIGIAERVFRIYCLSSSCELTLVSARCFTLAN